MCHHLNNSHHWTIFGLSQLLEFVISCNSVDITRKVLHNITTSGCLLQLVAAKQPVCKAPTVGWDWAEKQTSKATISGDCWCLTSMWWQDRVDRPVWRAGEGHEGKEPSKFTNPSQHKPATLKSWVVIISLSWNSQNDSSVASQVNVRPYRTDTCISQNRIISIMVARLCQKPRSVMTLFISKWSHVRLKWSRLVVLPVCFCDTSFLPHYSLAFDFVEAADSAL